MVFFGHIGLTLGGGWLVHSTSRSTSLADWRPARGAASFIQRYMDLRWLMLGSLLPDIVDKPLSLLPLDGIFPHGRVVAHTLLFSLALLLAGLLARPRAKPLLLMLATGSLGHLALDSMWLQPKTLFWPALGWGFQKLDIGPLVPYVIHGLQHNLALFLSEIAGAATLSVFIVYLAVKQRMRSFLTKGTYPSSD